MKKENKRMAQARRAKAREKKARINKLLQFIWVPFVVAFIAFVVFIVKDINKTNNEVAASAAAQGSIYEESSSAVNLKTDPSLAVVSGDTVNIDYIGYVDGVEFKGGNTMGGGADLKIGSHTYISGFEEQIIGHKPGETFDINVTFPNGYGDTTTVNGDVVALSNKDVVFTITLNGIYR